jgi:leader peptidase (prepilin peptidase)/N-methyltransferase
VTDLETVPTAVAGLVALVLGLLVPALIARIPEPDPHQEPGEGDAELPGGQPGQETVAQAVAEPAEPKELYADIAGLRGLAWKSALASGLCGALLGAGLGWSWPLVFLVPLVPVSVALSVVDWRTRLLPTRVISPTYLGVIGLVVVCWLATGDTGDLVRAGAGGLIAGGFYYLLWLVYPRGMGFGDVRLSGVVGIALGYLGWQELLVGVYAGFLLGGVLGGTLALLRRVDRKGYPFGPFMLLGALVGVVLGDTVASGLVP